MKKRGRGFWKPWYAVIGIILLPVVVGALIWALSADSNVAVLNPQGVVAAQQKDLILFTLALSAIVVIPVFIILALFAWRYQDGAHKGAYTPEVDGNRRIEALWWGIPIVIIGILSVVTWVTSHQLDPHKVLNSNVKPLQVQVVALQWRWLFIYPEQHVATIDELVIPAGTPVNFEITADAPMSAFWIPNLGTQTYAMTGMTSKLSLMADKAGTYPGTNSNINGKGYSKMDFNAVALESRRDFDLWAKAIVDKDSHDTLDWNEYKNVAKPNQNNDVHYYHLHDREMYTKVVNQYTAHGGPESGEAMEPHVIEHREGEGN